MAAGTGSTGQGGTGNGRQKRRERGTENALASLFGNGGLLARLSGHTRRAKRLRPPLPPPPIALRPRSDRLLQMARGIALDHCGRSRPQAGKRPPAALFDGTLLHREAPSRPPPEERLLGVCRALAAQPHCYRQALILRKVYGLSLSEVAARLGVSAERVEKLIGRSLAGLQQHLQDKGLG